MKFRRKTGKGKGMQGERAGKFSSWRAQARYQVSAALAARQGLHHGSHQRQLGAQRQLPSQSQSQFPRQLRGNATPGVSRQMYEMRAFEKFQQSLKRARVPPRSPDSAKDSAELSFLRHRIREERRRRASHVPPLLMLCAQKIAASLADLGEEELEWLSFFPVNVKEELLREASFLSLGKICDSAGPGVVGDRLVRELIDPAMETLMLSCSDVTDDFVQLIEPRLVHEQEEVEEEEEEEEDGEGDEGQRKDVEDGDKGREPGSASWEISALRTLESVSIRGLSQLRKLDISFCEQLTEDVMEPLGQACPGLQWLSLAGNFNRGDVFGPLVLQLGVVRSDDPGEVIRAEHCAEVAKVVALLLDDTRRFVMTLFSMRKLTTWSAPICWAAVATPSVARTTASDVSSS
ncbi:F-box/LRR-repeat protein 13 [Durusdinium trenchii]|uniref:F-box/LRR-repeat protein 13 n=1 Tax=Durusdinium trenchii TaxID=1381693 RepID=A0ABP0RXX9_9DINO